MSRSLKVERSVRNFERVERVGWLYGEKIRLGERFIVY